MLPTSIQHPADSCLLPGHAPRWTSSLSLSLSSGHPSFATIAQTAEAPQSSPTLAAKRRDPGGRHAAGSQDAPGNAKRMQHQRNQHQRKPANTKGTKETRWPQGGRAMHAHHRATSARHAAGAHCAPATTQRAPATSRHLPQAPRLGTPQTPATAHREPTNQTKESTT